MTDLVIRPLEAGEEALFLSLSDLSPSDLSPSDPALVGVASIGRSFTETLKSRQYRPEWTYVALDDGRVVARAAWWAGPDDAQPRTLDWFDPGADLRVGAALLRAAPFRCEYCLILPPAWRDQPNVRAAAEARIEAAGLAGYRPYVERLRYTWMPADGLPERPARLRYRPAPDDDAVLDVLRQVHSVTLDAHERRTAERLGAEAAASEELEFLRWLPGPRDWWRLAYDEVGALVGIVVPSRNYASPIIAFVGVVPGQRGHGYGYDLLVEGTHLLVAEGVEQIAADTDTTNTPMAAVFARAGYPITQQRIMLSLE